MAPAIIPVDAFDYVIFGATGDLTMRKLLPALYHRFRDGQIPKEARIIGAARSGHTTEKFREIAAEALSRFVKKATYDEKTATDFVELVHYAQVNGATAENWPNLAGYFEEATSDRVRVFYLATAPGLYGDTCRNLSERGLVTPHARVVLEKPIGTDLASARKINEDVGKFFNENQIFRIDHYLGKETVQNLMALRFANSIFERLWNADCIDHVQITAAETVGLEGRASYYDTSGALRDMVQNHLLQCLCMLAMEPPASLDGDAVRDEKLKVLRSLKPLDPHEVAVCTVRGQYVRGNSDGKPVPGYLDELNRDGGSSTETFVAIKAEIRNWRWGKVPFYLRTGKRLPTRVSEIVVQFREVPFNAFPKEAGEIKPNQLIIRLQPNEGIQMVLTNKDPGPGGMRLRPATLNISFEEAFSTRFPDAYERLLMDTVRGNSVLFMRRDEVEAAWTWVEPILESWTATPEAPMPYPAGSWGPTAAIALIERDGRSWHEDLG